MIVNQTRGQSSWNLFAKKNDAHVTYHIHHPNIDHILSTSKLIYRLNKISHNIVHVT